jgi:microcystin-dependent protein
MAGTINLSLSQQFDMDGRPLSGGHLFFFSAGTTTPQSAFIDQTLTIVHPNPIELDASGRVPMFYLADGQIKIRLEDKNGVTVTAADNLLVIGPSTGGGGSSPVDPTTVMQTADIKARFGTGQLTGFVRCNGLDIGNASSGAAERANADCESLFKYLWQIGVVVISPSRGATAQADWDAAKRCALPDLRGRTIAGMDDMGTTSAGRLTSTFFGIAATQIGNAGGSESHALTTAQLAVHGHADVGHVHNVIGNTAGHSNDHTHGPGSLATGNANADHTHGPGSLGTGNVSNDHNHTFGGTTAGINSSLDHTHNVTATGSNTTVGAGGGTAGAAVSSLTTSGSSLGQMDHSHNFSGTTSGISANHSHAVVSGATGGMSATHQHTLVSGSTSGVSADHTHGVNFASQAGVAQIQNAGGGQAHSSANPSMVMTFYIKL